MLDSFIGGGNWSIWRKPQTCRSHWQALSRNVLSSILAWAVFELRTVVMIDTYCIGSYKSNCRAITTRRLLVTVCIHIEYLASILKIKMRKTNYEILFVSRWLEGHSRNVLCTKLAIYVFICKLYLAEQLSYLMSAWLKWNPASTIW
jgi:hypothetical protein